LIRQYQRNRLCHQVGAPQVDEALDAEQVSNPGPVGGLLRVDRSQSVENGRHVAPHDPQRWAT
jgi:hypothetical protein